MEAKFPFRPRIREFCWRFPPRKRMRSIASWNSISLHSDSCNRGHARGNVQKLSGRFRVLIARNEKTAQTREEAETADFMAALARASRPALSGAKRVSRATAFRRRKIPYGCREPRTRRARRSPAEVGLNARRSGRAPRPRNGEARDDFAPFSRRSGSEGPRQGGRG